MNRKTREAWLNEVAYAMRPLFADQAAHIPRKIRVTCGFPSKSALSNKRGRIGECWTSEASEDGHFEIMISPRIADPVFVAGVLAHELTHAAVGLKEGHKGRFRAVATAIGLTGKMTATVPGEAFKRSVAPILKAAGKYPHAMLNAGKSSGPKKQGTRMLKVVCPECGYTARVTRKWLDEAGAPLCPAHGIPLAEQDAEGEGA